MLSADSAIKALAMDKQRSAPLTRTDLQLGTNGDRGREAFEGVHALLGIFEELPGRGNVRRKTTGQLRIQRSGLEGVGNAARASGRLSMGSDERCKHEMEPEKAEPPTVQV